MKHLTFTVPDEIAERLDDFCDRYAKSRNQVLRALLIESLTLTESNPGPNPNPGPSLHDYTDQPQAAADL